MKTIIFALLIISTTALCQQKKVDTLRNIPIAEIKKLEEIRRQKQELINLEKTMIESAFLYNGLPVPENKEYYNGVILYIKDDKKEPGK